MNLTVNFTQLIDQLRAMDRMVIAAFVVSVFVVLYSGSLGLQWWQSTQLAGSLEAQAQQLETAARNLARDQASPDASLPQRILELEEITASYTFANDDIVIGLIDRIAREARVTATTISPSDAGTETKGPISYQVRNASIRVEGQAKRLLQFMDDLSVAAPGLTIVGTRMGGLEGAPWAILSTKFLTNPTPAQVEE